MDDALAKLKKLNLVEQSADGLSVTTIENACEQLDRRWDEYFKFNKTGHET